MSDTPTPGLTTPSQSADDGDNPSRIDGVIGAAADGATLSTEDQDYLTEYFLGGKALAPGEATDEYLKREVNISAGKEPRCQPFTFRTITWDEWQVAGQQGTVRRRGEETVDPFRRASYTAAYACIEPDLGKLRTAIPEEWTDGNGELHKRPADTAELLRVFFRLLPGALIDIEQEVLRASKLMTAESAVREVAAAGN